MPSIIRHRGYREVADLVTKTNDAALGLLVGEQIARTELKALEPSAATQPLTSIYSEAAVPDVSRFDFRVGKAISKMREAERELCVMAVPFAVSLYNEYLVKAAEMLELAHITRPAKPARNMMLGELESYLQGQKVGAEKDPLDLLRLIKEVRNRIVHAAGITSDKPIVQWNNLSAPAKASWAKVTGRPMPFNGPHERIPWEGPEIRGVFLVVREALKQVNLSLQAALPREFWADLAVHEHWVDAYETGTSSHRKDSPVNFANYNGYRSLGFQPAELKAASQRAKTLGWRPDLQPYWQRPIPPGAPMTKTVTGRDLKQGRIRIPDSAKSLFPSAKGTVAIRIRECPVACPYNPEPQRGRNRSGLLYVGSALEKVMVAGQQLSVFPISSTEIGLQ